MRGGGGESADSVCGFRFGKADRRLHVRRRTLCITDSIRQNPNARFSAPNKLYEALAAGRPLITGDFGEIADVVREAECGIVLPVYSAEEIRKALAAMKDPRGPRCHGAERQAMRADHDELGKGRRGSVPGVFGVAAGRLEAQPSAVRNDSRSSRRSIG